MRKRSWSGRSGLAALLLSGAFAAAPAAGDNELVLKPVADRPAEFLVRERCQECHGMEGQSSKPYYPKLAGQNVDYLVRQLANFKTGVRSDKEMARQVADLTGGEMQALAQYFSAKPLTPDKDPDPILSQVGRTIYFSGNPATGVTACVTCHGPDGRGAMYLPRLAGQHARYIERQIRAFLDQSRSSPDMVMHSVVMNMSEAEIRGAADFLSAME